jgi:hypothetical protein
MEIAERIERDYAVAVRTGDRTTVQSAKYEWPSRPATGAT